MDQEKIGKFIATLRKEKNLTQEELGNKLGVTKNAVSKWERGISFMDVSLLKPLSTILEVSITEILNGERISKEDTNKNDEIIVNTIKYSDNKIKKNKYKNIILTTLSIILLTLISTLSYKFILLEKYKFIVPEDYKEIKEGLTIRDNKKIYKKTINEDQYLEFNDIKLRNDFKDYEVINKNDNVLQLRKNNLEKNSIMIGSNYQYINLFTENDTQFFINNKPNIFNYKNDFNKINRKYFLLHEDINNDVDYIKYIINNYYKKNNILLSKREMMENYAFNLFTSTIITKVKSITFIDGDYNGYILNNDKYRQINIIRNNKVYYITLFGEDLLNDNYIYDLISTIEIK